MYVNGIKQKRPLNPVYGGDIPEYSSGSIEIRDTDSDDAYKIQWVLATDPETGKKLLIADRNILSFVSWDKLNGQNLVSGKDITIDSSSFKIRLLTGGSDYKDSSNPYAGASNLNNEWDQIINRGDGIEPSYQIDKIYNADDQSKYGSWFTVFYAKSLYDNNDLMQFALNDTFGTATLSNGGVIQDESQIRDKYFLSDGSMILIDNYGMVQYYKDLTTTSPATLPIDGSGIIGADTLVFGTGTSAVKHPVLYFGSSSKYIDTDGSLKTFTLKSTDVKKMFAYKYAKGISQYMLIQKSDGSLVYLDADGHQQDFGLNMNDVSYIMPATGVNKDIFVMKDGTLRDDQGVIVVPDGVTLSKIWSNRIFEMSDGFLYTFQNGTFKNTNTLASFAKLAQNNALLLKNGNFQLADTSGNLTNDLDVSGNDVKYMSQLDSTNMYLILNDGTTYGVGDKVQGDSLENHGININDVSAFLSNGSDNVVRALVTKDGTVYTNPGSWAKNTLVHFSSDAVNSAHDTNPVYTNPGDAAGSGDPNKLPGGTDEKGNGINPIIAEDTTGPTINITGSPTDWTNGDVTLSYSASDEEGGSGFSKVVLPDNTEVTSTTGTFKVTENGTYMFKAVDNDGNETTQTVTVSKIDKIAPTVPSISNDNGTVTIAAGTDADSGVKETDYSIDGGAYQKYGSAFTLEPGIHTVKAKDIDNAGNESSEVTQNVTVEDTAFENATQAVENAESTKSQGDVDTARDLVDALPESPEKQALEDRLDTVQDEIDQAKQDEQNLKDASDAVDHAEDTENQDDLDHAKDLVDNLPDGPGKDNLEDRIDDIQDEIDQNSQEAQDLADATAAVEKAESTQLQEDVYSARVLVNKLPYSQDRTDLNRRLDAVQNIINLYKNAEQRVQAAEKLKTESAVSSARSVVSKLPDGDRKDSLNARLDVVEAEIVIDNTIKAIDRDITALEKDVDSHIKYNSNIDIDSYKNKVTALRDRVNALPDSVSGTKLAFNERLDTVDSKLTKQKGVQDAVSKVVDAIDKAGQTLDNKDIQDAQDAIDNLPDGVDRSQYQSELNTIKQKKQAKVAKDTTDANKAVTTASRTRLQSDIDAARVLVNALPDGNNKTQLSKQLDLIQKYVKK
ncbi:OmpL47-type beta-barrel domain-containing protein [Clostridium sp. MT-14]|uniref:OmpL47-type beta-barrel domain-containing protein n=1 Tax=Clostridium sp. MT-14 TaxID=3348360 RepID=UPI0015D39542